MKKILYVGNKLDKGSSNISYISILGNLLEKEGFTVFYASSVHNKMLRLFHMISTVCKLRKKVDIVFIDTYSTQNFYYAFVISQLCRVFNLAYVPILHGGNLPSRLASNPKLSDMIFSHAKCNVSPSPYLKNAFYDHGFTNIQHIPNTLEIKNYQSESRTYNTPKLFWVRSFSKIYNPQLAIKVYNTIRTTHPNAELCMVGPDSDGSLAETKLLAQELNLDVKFTGKLSKIEWINLSKNYNVFINTTNFDNTPLSVIEAMALGLPVVSTNVGGMPFLIQHGIEGVLVEANQVEEMALAICHIVDTPDFRDSIIKNARKKVEQFDWANVKKLWFEILGQDNS